MDDYNLKLIGYYQSYKYFENNQEEIIKLIDLRNQQKLKINLLILMILIIQFLYIFVLEIIN